MKLELYKPYKTRGGHKAVVVAGPDKDGGYQVCHIPIDGRPEYVCSHKEDGLLFDKFDGLNNLEIVSEWHEPRKGEFWVNVHDGYAVSWLSKHGADKNKLDRVAVKHITWTEGDQE